MKHHELVLPNHLNHYNFLYGGQLLYWIDKVGYIAANCEFPKHEFVTIGLNEVIFHKSIPAGSVLEFNTELIKKGSTSATFEIEVHCDNRETKELVFKTQITFVSIDKTGKKTPIRT